MPKCSQQRYAKITVRVPIELYNSVQDKLSANGTNFETYIRMCMRSYTKMPRRFALMDRITFGRYRDEYVENVIRVDPEYVAWCVGNVDGFKLDVPAHNLLRSIQDNISIKEIPF